ncbi:hypothetical protein PRUPE_2G125200 [Prunus persica]|uniref:Uncharacterized protein n=1 Tax=Prunus persica TaxID=3760 RepID=A0A251QF23_PRUPE|nr:hypothetical protein PRUPE_2G125200 [Prunus persica]ONI22378.1 hypothetical protein PRUPE_2G125200 [Prunus persica]
MTIYSISIMILARLTSQTFPAKRKKKKFSNFFTLTEECATLFKGDFGVPKHRSNSVVILETGRVHKDRSLTYANRTFVTAKCYSSAATEIRFNSINSFHTDCSSIFKRRKTKSEITEKTENEDERPVRVLDKPDKWCIYRVPSKLRKVNEAAYTPQLLSIGPFHHGKPELKDMETHKKIYYENFLARFNKNDDELKQFIKTRQENILRCYAGTIELNKDFEDIIVVDACFIIELFLMNFCEPENHENDYILRSPWLRKAVEQDLILFENQLPYSLLQELYQDFAVPASSNFQPCKEVQEQANRHSNTNHYLQYCSPCCRHCFPCCWWIPSKDQSIVQVEPANDDPLLKLTCEFFKYYSKGKSVKNGVRPKHFTDLVRYFLRPDKEMDFEHSSTPIKNIYAARKLRASGVKFRPLKEGHFIIEKDEATKCKFNLACFRNMDLKLTQFCVKDETECVVRNIMALEQFLYPDKPYICNYFLLMDQLVDTVDDVDFLVENRVILNMLGSNEAVAKLVNRLCQQIMDDKSCYFDICEQLNKHHENFWNRHVATLKRVYFKDLWTGSSTVLGVVVLVFSVIGTIKSLTS